MSYYGYSQQYPSHYARYIVAPPPPPIHPAYQQYQQWTAPRRKTARAFTTCTCGHWCFNDKLQKSDGMCTRCGKSMVHGGAGNQRQWQWPQTNHARSASGADGRSRGVNDANGIDKFMGILDGIMDVVKGSTDPKTIEVMAKIAAIKGTIGQDDTSLLRDKGQSLAKEQKAAIGKRNDIQVRLIAKKAKATELKAALDQANEQAAKLQEEMETAQSQCDDIDRKIKDSMKAAPAHTTAESAEEAIKRCQAEMETDEKEADDRIAAIKRDLEQVQAKSDSMKRRRTELDVRAVKAATAKSAREKAEIAARAAKESKDSITGTADEEGQQRAADAQQRADELATIAEEAEKQLSENPH